MAMSRGLATGCGAAVAVLVVLLTSRPGDIPTDHTGPATLPNRMADYSLLTGTVSSSPAGRAVALYQHGWGVEFMDYPHAEVLGADGDVYRWVDEADNRADGLSQGDPGPMLLSPDGDQVAVGDFNGIRPDLALVDLATADVAHHRLSAGQSLLPVAWSPDGSRIAYLANEEPTNPYRGTPITGTVGLFDVDTGTAEQLADADDVQTVAFSPDGTEVAIQRRSSAGNVDILSLVGGAPRSIEVRGQLAGAAAWSPDGTVLATVVDTSGQRSVLSFAAAGPVREVPRPISIDLAPNSIDYTSNTASMLGWRSPTEVLLMTELSEDVASDSYWVIAVPLGGGEPRRLMEIPENNSYGVGRFMLASGLVRGIEVRPAGEVNRGPWPWEWRMPRRAGRRTHRHGGRGPRTPTHPSPCDAGPEHDQPRDHSPSDGVAIGPIRTRGRPAGRRRRRSRGPRVSRTVVGMPFASSRRTNSRSSSGSEAVHLLPGVGLSGIRLTCTQPQSPYEFRTSPSRSARQAWSLMPRIMAYSIETRRLVVRA